MLKQKTNKNGSFAALISISVLLLLIILLENISDRIPGLPAVFLPTSQLFTVLKKGAVYSLVAVSMNLLNGFTGLFSLGQAGFMLLGAYTYAILTVPMAAKDQVYYLYGGSAVKFSLVDMFQSFLGSAGFGGGLALVLAVLVGLILAGLVAALFAALHTGLRRNTPGDLPVADPWPHYQRREYDQRLPHLLRFQYQKRRGAGDSAAEYIRSLPCGDHLHCPDRSADQLLLRPRL